MEEKEIKRKFFASSMPDLEGRKREEYERYYLYRDKEVNLRIQRIDDRYELERMVETSNLAREKFTTPLNKQEFDLLKTLARDSIVRDSYKLSDDPVTHLRIYHGKFDGLRRIEVSFHSEEEATSYSPPDWFGKEITNTPLWRDNSLLELSEDDFKTLLSNYSK